MKTEPEPYEPGGTQQSACMATAVAFVLARMLDRDEMPHKIAESTESRKRPAKSPRVNKILTKTFGYSLALRETTNEKIFTPWFLVQNA